jgi:ornithine decarboxylase
MHCLRPDTIVEAAANFVAGFPGDVLYAVKCNPDPVVLLAVWDGGGRHFDCASAPEIALVRRLLPDAAIHFMHPVKSRPAIRAAWAAGVRDFSLDHPHELAKIRQETGGDGELGPFVRLAMPRGRAAYDSRGNLAPRWKTPPRCCAPPGRMRRRLGFAFTSDRSASTRWPGATRWRWPGPRSSGPA